MYFCVHITKNAQHIPLYNWFTMSVKPLCETEIHQHISLWKGSTNFTSQKYTRAFQLLPFWPMLGIINFIFYGSPIVYYFNFISLFTATFVEHLFTHWCLVIDPSIISLLLKLEFVVLSILRELYLININRVQEKLS